jgi:hypothetical protein
LPTVKDFRAGYGNITVPHGGNPHITPKISSCNEPSFGLAPRRVAEMFGTLDRVRGYAMDRPFARAGLALYPFKGDTCFIK